MFKPIARDGHCLKLPLLASLYLAPITLGSVAWKLKKVVQESIFYQTPYGSFDKSFTSMRKLKLFSEIRRKTPQRAFRHCFR